MPNILNRPSSNLKPFFKPKLKPKLFLLNCLPDPIGDIALERAHAHSAVAVVVIAGTADEGGGEKKSDEENIDKGSTYHMHIHIKLTTFKS